MVASYSTGGIGELASAADIKLFPIDVAGAAASTDVYRFFAHSEIPACTYEGLDAVYTVSVGCFARWWVGIVSFLFIAPGLVTMAIGVALLSPIVIQQSLAKRADAASD